MRDVTPPKKDKAATERYTIAKSENIIYVISHVLNKYIY